MAHSWGFSSLVLLKSPVRFHSFQIASLNSEHRREYLFLLYRLRQGRGQGNGICKPRSPNTTQHTKQTLIVMFGNC